MSLKIMNLALECFIISCCLFEMNADPEEHCVKIKKEGAIAPSLKIIERYGYAFCAFLEYIYNPMKATIRIAGNRSILERVD